VAPPTVRVELYPSLAGLPLFNPDLDATALAAVAQLRERIVTADAVLIASPEYAHGVSEHRSAIAACARGALRDPENDVGKADRGRLRRYTDTGIGAGRTRHRIACAARREPARALLALTAI